MADLRIAGLIPARGGSKRIFRKNIRKLGPFPLIAYTIAAARSAYAIGMDAQLGERLYVSTDDPEIGDIASRYGSSVLMVNDGSAHDPDKGHADINWVQHALRNLPEIDAFVILRPTSPFRRRVTIERALTRFLGIDGNCDSLRAVEVAKQTPYKMWRIVERDSPTQYMVPLMDPPTTAAEIIRGNGVPRHSSPSEWLPTVYAQNASLEIAWASMVERTGTIAGERIIPFYTEHPEGFDINTEDDWREAERLVSLGHLNENIALVRR